MHKKQVHPVNKCERSLCRLVPESEISKRQYKSIQFGLFFFYLINVNIVFGRWVPESEKGKFVTFTYNGGTVGAIITFPLCGDHHHLVISHRSFLLLSLSLSNFSISYQCQISSGIIVQNTSWVWIFYSSAILTFIWAGLWAIFFYDMPEDDPFITGKCLVPQLGP